MKGIILADGTSTRLYSVAIGYCYHSSQHKQM